MHYCLIELSTGANIAKYIKHLSHVGEQAKLTCSVERLLKSIWSDETVRQRISTRAHSNVCKVGYMRFRYGFYFCGFYRCVNPGASFKIFIFGRYPACECFAGVMHWEKPHKLNSSLWYMNDSNLGQVVQSISSFTSSLVGNMLTVLVSTILIREYSCWKKNVISFCKCKSSLHVSAKLLAYMPHLMIKFSTIR